MNHLFYFNWHSYEWNTKWLIYTTVTLTLIPIYANTYLYACTQKLTGHKGVYFRHLQGRFSNKPMIVSKFAFIYFRRRIILGRCAFIMQYVHQRLCSVFLSMFVLTWTWRGNAAACTTVSITFLYYNRQCNCIYFWIIIM